MNDPRDWNEELLSNGWRVADQEIAFGVDNAGVPIARVTSVLTPQAVPQKAPEKPPAQAPSTLDISDKNAVWSALLDELLRRHLATFSLLTAQCWPLSINETALVIGVQSEGIRDSFNRRWFHVTDALAVITGKRLNVQVVVDPQEEEQRKPPETPKPAKKSSLPRPIGSGKAPAPYLVDGKDADICKGCKRIVPIEGNHNCKSGSRPIER